VSVSKSYEAILGRFAPTASFTVTDAMARQLRTSPYSIRSPILTLHDRPASIFQPIEDPAIRLQFLSRMPETSHYAKDIVTGKASLLVSSTSWTPDEDFSLFLDALVSYSASRTLNQSKLPPIIAIITGKGPQKQHYLDRIVALNESKKLVGVKIMTAWLSIEDYARLLACAHLGVCLHKSSSGVDLPMKVVDMFGAGLPVAGYSGYESWPELVTERETGRGFTTSNGLKDIMEELLGNLAGENGSSEITLNSMREKVLINGKRRWDEEWDSVAGRLLGLCD
jgi:beta-1,4-mannosyltransferase